jgi:phage terminase large subunit-like protein
VGNQGHTVHCSPLRNMDRGVGRPDAPRLGRRSDDTIRRRRGSDQDTAKASPNRQAHEARRCLFGGSFPELEDELTAIMVEGHSGGPPDRADVMVWALTELVLRAPAEPRVRAL